MGALHGIKHGYNLVNQFINFFILISFVALSVDQLHPYISQQLEH